jgi:exocyst complex component 1
MSIPSAKSKSKAAFPDHSSSYSYFYRYAGFILFAKEVDPGSYADIQELYLSPAGRSYKDDLRVFVNKWKSVGRKATSDELELIFSLVKENQNTVSAVRSASIKRAGSVAKTLRSPDKDREKSEQEGKVPVGQVFHEILSVVIPAFVKEQSFVIEFLQLSPNTKRSYEEFVRSGADKTAWMRDLDKKRPAELDKNASKDVITAMESMLSWLPDELSSIVEWCRTMDALYDPLEIPLIARQLVTVLGVLDRHITEWEDSDQAFIVKILNKQHDKLGGLFHRFVEEEVRAIEDMKVTAKKRQGVLLMFKIFPVLLPLTSSSYVRVLLKKSRFSLTRH